MVILKNSVSAPSGERTLHFCTCSLCFFVGYTNCIHQSLGDAIGLENLKHLSPVHRIKGISEVNECNYCQQVSGSDPFINFS